jgi:spore coat polysaccharide biosynthesis protein SpsF
MGSSRLPGKVMLPLAGKPVIAHVIERCAAITGIETVCIATTILHRDDVVAETAESLGAVVFRGSEDDVLDRYAQAARMLDADVVLRVTCDDPVLDPFLCAAVLRARVDEEADFATNNLPPSWPYGLDCEVFTREWLERSDREAKTAHEREHVGPYVRNSAEARRVNVRSAMFLNHHRLTLDTEEDRAFLEMLFERIPIAPELWDHRRLIAAMETDPELLAASTAPDRAGVFLAPSREPSGTIQIVVEE